MINYNYGEKAQLYRHRQLVLHLFIDTAVRPQRVAQVAFENPAHFAVFLGYDSNPPPILCGNRYVKTERLLDSAHIYVYPPELEPI